MSFAERRKLARKLFPDITMSDGEALELPDTYLVDGAFEATARRGSDIQVQLVGKGFGLRAMRMWPKPRPQDETDDYVDDRDSLFPERKFHASYQVSWNKIAMLEANSTLEQIGRLTDEVGWCQYEALRSSWSSDLLMRGYNPQLFDAHLAHSYTPIDPELSSRLVQKVLKVLVQQADYLRDHDLSRLTVAGVFVDGQPKIFEVIV